MTILRNRVYQTVQDRDNPDEVELYGPFKCKKNPWLGQGYYFWDHEIKLAHWWGSKAGYENNYMICEAWCNMTGNDLCWDLHENGFHRDEFHETILKIVELNLSKKPHDITVDQVIEFVKNKKSFKYEAIRILGVNSVKKIKGFKNVGARMLFRRGKEAYYDIFPAVQICFFNKKSLSLSKIKIVYPEYYKEDEVF